MASTDSARRLAGGPETARPWPAWQVPAAAVVEWLALQVAVEVVRAGGGSTPCEWDPDGWWVTGEDAQAVAVEACGWCPVRVECASYAVAGREREGVWGGLTPPERRAVAGR